MAKKKIDIETQQILTEGQQIERWVNSDDWKLVKKKLMSRLITVDSISSVPSENLSNEQLLREYSVRNGAVNLVIDWIKDIEGTAMNNKTNQEIFKEAREDSIVQYFN